VQPSPRFHVNSTTALALYHRATARKRATSDAFGSRALPPFICTKTKSKRSPDLSRPWVDAAVSLRTAKTSTMPRHSPPPRPRKEINLQRLATRLDSARNSISVHLSVFAARCCDVCAKLGTDKVEIAVRDTGVGISSEDQASLFEEFKQLGKDRSRKAEGTGLGLALTKRLVKLLGGQILVDSAVGHGSTFRVTLPVRN